MDGLASTQTDLEGRNEVDFFRDVFLDQLTPSARARWQNDPSNDDYRFFRGTDFDDTGADILERYKRFNAPEGNSVTDEDSPEDYPTQQTTMPTTEDINQDQNLSESESYFHYRVRLRPAGHGGGSQLHHRPDPGHGQHPGGPQAGLLVPVQSPGAPARRGGQRDPGFPQHPLHAHVCERLAAGGDLALRAVGIRARGMAQIQLQPWTPRAKDRLSIGPDHGVRGGRGEHRGERQPHPINYVLPPDINQEIDVASANLRNLNEQSLQLKTCNLRDGDARASFRNVSFDIRSYKKLRMYVHAESSDPNRPLNYGDVIRVHALGQRLTTRTTTSTKCPWTPIGVLQPRPVQRLAGSEQHDHRVRQAQRPQDPAGPSGIPEEHSVRRADGDRRVFVKGNPNLSQMRTVMIGIRNPKKEGEEANPWAQDDGHAAVLGGVGERAATDGLRPARRLGCIGAGERQLADLGTVSVAGNYSTPFWGSIDKKVSERQRETKYGVDVSANLEMGKFLPEASKVKVPMYVGIPSRSAIRSSIR
jgi:hypothetical protein